ncbi:MAG: hypothetical protein QME51_10980 [Planctomycetota bacterium]|nr:hypothetical protein [Planctomycetota bacterium]
MSQNKLQKYSSHIRVYIPAYNEFPKEKAQKWADSYYKRIPHIRVALRKKVRFQKAYRKEIAQPLIEAYQKIFGDSNLNRKPWRGHTQEHMIQALIYEILSRESARNYLRNLDKAYGIKDGVRAPRLKKRLPFYAAYYALKMTFRNWRYLGPIDGQGEGGFVLAGEWLTGRMDCLGFFRDKDQRLQGHPVLITAPERASKFRLALRNKLAFSLTRIDNSNHAPDVVREQNDGFNEFVNDFIRPEIEPFRSDGDSHINFVVLPETAKSFWCKEFRELSYKICRQFFDKRLRATEEWVDKIDPSIIPTFIGRQELKYRVRADMYLDIKVSRYA